MKLSEYQRAMVELSFAEREVMPEELAAFGLYRHMIRARLFAMAQVAFRRTWALLGDEACSASFSRYLALYPPRSALIREVISSFGAFAEVDVLLLGAGAAHAGDLLRFEGAKWRVGSAPFDSALMGAKLREVDFDGVLVVNPTLEWLSLSFAVTEESAAASSHTLFVYRRRDSDDVRWYRGSSSFAALLSLHSSRSGASLGSLVQELFSSGVFSGSDVGASLSDLAAELAVAVERDVLWGVLS